MSVRGRRLPGPQRGRRAACTQHGLGALAGIGLSRDGDGTGHASCTAQRRASAAQQRGSRADSAKNSRTVGSERARRPWPALKASRGGPGPPVASRELGHRAMNRKRVERLMRERRPLQRRRPQKGPGFFRVEHPDQLRHMDMANVWVAEHGWCCLNGIIDRCTREIPGWSTFAAAAPRPLRVALDAIADRQLEPAQRRAAPPTALRSPLTADPRHAARSRGNLEGSRRPRNPAQDQLPRHCAVTRSALAEPVRAAPG